MNYTSHRRIKTFVLKKNGNLVGFFELIFNKDDLEKPFKLSNKTHNATQPPQLNKLVRVVTSFQITYFTLLFNTFCFPRFYRVFKSIHSASHFKT